MKDLKNIEFCSSPEGMVIVQMDGKIFNLTESHHELLQNLFLSSTHKHGRLLELITNQLRAIAGIIFIRK